MNSIAITYIVSILLSGFIGYVCGARYGYTDGVRDVAATVEYIFENADKIEIRDEEEEEQTE